MNGLILQTFGTAKIWQITGFLQENWAEPGVGYNDRITANLAQMLSFVSNKCEEMMGKNFQLNFLENMGYIRTPCFVVKSY